jgi:hypothetical protein
MKKYYLLDVSVFLVSLFITTTGLSAQSNSIEQRLVGTWVIEKAISGGMLAVARGEYTLTFNSNGTFTQTITYNEILSLSGRWAVSGSKIFFLNEYVDSDYNIPYFTIEDIFLSPDGKTLFFCYDTEQLVYSEFKKK